MAFNDRQLDPQTIPQDQRTRCLLFKISKKLLKGAKEVFKLNIRSRRRQWTAGSVGLVAKVPAQVLGLITTACHLRLVVERCWARVSVLAFVLATCAETARMEGLLVWRELTCIGRGRRRSVAREESSSCRSWSRFYWRRRASSWGIGATSETSPSGERRRGTAGLRRFGPALDEEAQLKPLSSPSRWGAFWQHRGKRSAFDEEAEMEKPLSSPSRWATFRHHRGKRGALDEEADTEKPLNSPSKWGTFWHHRGKRASLDQEAEMEKPLSSPSKWGAFWHHRGKRSAQEETEMNPSRWGTYWRHRGKRSALDEEAQMEPLSSPSRWATFRHHRGKRDALDQEATMETPLSSPSRWGAFWHHRGKRAAHGQEAAMEKPLSSPSKWGAFWQHRGKRDAQEEVEVTPLNNPSKWGAFWHHRGKRGALGEEAQMKPLSSPSRWATFSKHRGKRAAPSKEVISMFFSTKSTEELKKELPGDVIIDDLGVTFAATKKGYCGANKPLYYAKVEVNGYAETFYTTDLKELEEVTTENPKFNGEGLEKGVAFYIWG
uniref:SH3 domain-containing protein n=1 Tax=Steinernema glaseri TaxID=37863 RepID=A0A1I7YBQ1_9BILA